MCRSIKPLFNFTPPATDEEVRDASVQFVRKVSGFTRPSKINEVAFRRAVDDISLAVQAMLGSMVTNAESKDRLKEKTRAHARMEKRFEKQ